MFRFENLEIWKGAIEYARQIYKVTSTFPKDEVYGLTIQLKRAAVSISSNIAEGSAPASKREFRSFLNYSSRSVAEVVSELKLAMLLNYLSNESYQSLYGASESLIKRITAFK